MAEAVGPKDCTPEEEDSTDTGNEISRDSIDVSGTVSEDIQATSAVKHEDTIPQNDNPPKCSEASVSFKVPVSTIKLKNPLSEKSTNSLSKDVSNVDATIEKAPKQINSNQPATSRKQHLSPAELLKQSQIPIPYKEPSWGGLSELKYSFEVLKNGTVIETQDLTTKSFYVFGRLPTCDIPMEHPSLSRHHAVIQYCQKKNDRHDIGWYLYDLDSTHGTWLNKNKIKPRIYYRIRVGYVVKFGGSSRLHVLQGPSEDQEEESELSLTELKEQKERQKKEIELLRHAEIIEMEEKKKLLESVSRDDGCSWGLDEDAAEVDTINPFAAEQPENEDLYIDDPKKSLKGYFEREGLDPPEYEITDMGRGKYQCTVELPVDSANGEPMVADVTVTGKKKEAVVACALEACRILDKMGELRKATHESRKRKSKNWEENDFYDSDEDTFLDRTGDIEKKRQQRMSRLSKSKPKAQSYDNIVSELEEVEKEMADIQQKLDEAKARSAAVEAEEGLDALDAFMANIKSGAMDTKTKMALKRRMFELKQQQMKLQKLANVAKPALVPVSIQQKVVTPPATGKGSLMFGKMKGVLHKPRVPSATTKSTIPKAENTEFTEEEEEEEDSEEENASQTEKNMGRKEKMSSESEKTKTDIQEKASEKSEKPLDSDRDIVVKDNEHLKKQSDESEQLVNKTQDTVKRKSEGSEKGEEIERSEKKLKVNNDSISEQTEKCSDTKNVFSKLQGEDSGGRLKGPMLPPPDEFVPERKIKSKVNKKSQKKKSASTTELTSTDPDYQTWLPPQNQSGDGRTALNEKYGY